MRIDVYAAAASRKQEQFKTMNAIIEEYKSKCSAYEDEVKCAQNSSSRGTVFSTRDHEKIEGYSCEGSSVSRGDAV
jgi:hypothetical protein